MKGLFYKEGRCLWQYGKSYILLVVIFFGLTFLNKGGEVRTRYGCCIRCFLWDLCRHHC